MKYQSFEEFKKKIQSAFNFPLSYCSTPYKMCSVRTIWGLALPQELQDYEFWGFCDCDLIFGEIRSFLTDSLLSKYDRLLSRGHLTLYRNAPEINASFMAMTEGTEYDWRRVLSKPQNAEVECFDEWGGTSVMWKEKMPQRFYDEICFDDVSSDKRNFISCQKAKVDSYNGRSHFIFHKKGKELYRVGLKDGLVFSEPTCYAHFQKRHLDVECHPCDEYLIIPNKIIPMEEITPEKLCVWSKGGVYWPYIQRRFRNLMRKVSRGLSSR